MPGKGVRTRVRVWEFTESQGPYAAVVRAAAPEPFRPAEIRLTAGEVYGEMEEPKMAKLS